MDATVIKVWAVHDLDGVGVNLFVVDPDNGVAHAEFSIEEGDERTKGRHYRWMPYQQGQAKKEAS